MIAGRSAFLQHLGHVGANASLNCKFHQSRAMFQLMSTEIIDLYKVNYPKAIALYHFDLQTAHVNSRYWCKYCLCYIMLK